MPTTFWGLFLLSTALSLAATFTVVGAIALVRRVGGGDDRKTPRLR